MIAERKRVPIHEVKRELFEIKKIRLEADPDVFFRQKPDASGSMQDATDIRIYLSAREKKAWERMSETRKRRVISRLEKGRSFQDYQEMTKKGVRIHETQKQIRFAEVSGGRERIQKRKGLPYQGTPDPAPVGWSERKDGTGTLPDTQTGTAVTEPRPAHAGKGAERTASMLSDAGSAGTASESFAEGVFTGGASVAMRYGIRAVKKAADVVRRSVTQKDEAKKEAAGHMLSVRSASIGGGAVSSSYASGAAGIFVRLAAVAVAAAAVFIQAMLLPALSIVLLAVILAATLFSTIAAAFTIFSAPGDMSYLSWAIAIAEDDSHGYSQAARTGPDYDCSSFVWYALQNAGYDVGVYPFATGSMPAVLSAAGFEQLPYTGMGDLIPGDILWVHGDEAQHTEMYLGEGQLVGASGDLDGGLPGDQSGTGAEIRVGGFYEDGWMGVFRSTAVGMGDILIPSSYEGYEVGTIYTCTPHYGTWNWAYSQGRVHAAWIESGCVYSENVAVIGDKYLIACTQTFGSVGDWVTFYFDDGSSIECIIADAKSTDDANYTPWGHIHGNQIDVIEAETDLTINPGTPGCVESWGGRRVVSATNHGVFA